MYDLTACNRTDLPPFENSHQRPSLNPLRVGLHSLSHQVTLYHITKCANLGHQTYRVAGFAP